MTITLLNIVRREAWRPLVRRFAAGHCERRMSAAAWQALERWDVAAAHVAIDESSRLIGVGIVYSEAAEALLVVHRHSRGRGIGRQLLTALLQDVPVLRCTVACDNAPSMQMCRASGLVECEWLSDASRRAKVIFKKGGFGASGESGHHDFIFE